MGSTTPRFGVGVNQDNTGRVETLGYQNPAYAASIALKLNSFVTLIVFQTLTGALSLTAEVARPFAGDELQLLFVSDGTGRTITFSTGFTVSAATLALTASKKGSIRFCFDGATWVETGRCVGI